MRLVMIGAPGAGKGTQAKILAKHFGVPHVSTGDLLREHTQRDNILGLAIKSIMDTGNLVPDSIVIDLIRDVIDSQTFIFDGFPRTLKQAEILHKMLMARSAPLHRAVCVTIDHNIIINRMAGRQCCRQCTAIFNLDFNPPETLGKCDHCGGELFVRNDDSEPVVRRRLRNYYSLTEPIIRYYRKQGLVYEIEGSNTIEEVTESIVNELDFMSSH